MPRAPRPASLPSPTPPRRLGAWLAACLLVGAAACVDATAQQNTAQALVDLGDQLSAMRQDNAALQQQVDSLGTVVARQDTLLRRIAAMAGVPATP